jgi:hypothetical protein
MRQHGCAKALAESLPQAQPFIELPNRRRKPAIFQPAFWHFYCFASA